MSAHQDRLKLEYSLKLYSDALARFSDALQLKPENDTSLVIDGSIQRFEFCFEMSWKTLKRFLEFKGTVAKTPRDSYKAGFKLGWLQSDEVWIRMIEDRNRTSHTYDRKVAREVYGNLAEYLPVFELLRIELQKILASELGGS